MMKRITKSLLALALSIMLLSMLPICSLALDAETPEQRQANLPYNAEYFFKASDARRTGTYPSYAYNGTLLEADNTIEIIGNEETYNFTIDTALLGITSNDVLAVTDAPQTVTLSGEPVKYIGIFANMKAEPGATTTSTTADLTLDFVSNNVNDKVFEDVTITSMFVNSGKSFSLETSLKTPNNPGQRFSAIDNDTYFNLIELDLENNINEVASITFGKADYDYHIIGIVEIGYTPTELEGIESSVVVDLIPKFVGGGVENLPKQSLHEIDSTEAGELQTILNVIDSSHEHYDYINNLLEGYKLYAPQKERKEDYDELAATYLDFTLEDIYADKENKDTHLSNLQQLLDFYDEQEATDKDALISIMDWAEFEMPVEEKNVFIELGSEKYAAISDIIADYPDYEKQKDLEKNIKELFDYYDGKTVAELNSDESKEHIAELSTLIGYYDAIDEITAEFTDAGKEDKIIVSYDDAERAFIEKLKNFYSNYQNSENNYHYDLTSYFNLGMTANPGDFVASYWGSNNTTKVDGVSYRAGILKSKWDKVAGETGIVAAKSNINYSLDGYRHIPSLDFYKSLTENYPTFKISTETDADDKNVVAFNSNTITIKGSGRMAKTLDLLSLGGQNNGNPRFDININYTDGTTQNQDIIAIWSGYWQAAVSGLTTSATGDAEIYNKNGVATAGSAKFIFTAFSIPLEEGKIIDDIVIKRKSGPEAILVALSEQVVSNDKFQNKFIELYNEVKEYDEDTFDINGATTFYYYCKEAENRGIDISTIKDADGNTVDDITVIEKFSNEILVANAKFKKEGKAEVVATVEFSQPVDKAQLEANLKVEKMGVEKYEKAEVSEITMSEDNKTATIKIVDKLLGGVEYKISILENLTVKNSDNKISKPYEFIYTSSAYIDFDVRGEFAKVNKDKFTATLSFTHGINTSELIDNITVTKAGKEFEDYSIDNITSTGAVITLSDEPLGNVQYKVLVSETLKLAGEFSEYNIGKTYEFVYDSKPYLSASEIADGKITITNTTNEGIYTYRLVATEIAKDDSDVFANYEKTITAYPGTSEVHTLGTNGTGNIFASLWDENQKLLVNISGDIKATTSKTDENADFKKPTLDTNNVLKIAGFTKGEKVKDKNITLEIFRTDSTVNSGNPKSFIKTQALTNEDGYFEIVISLNDKIMTDSEYKTGSLLSFSLGGDDFDAPVTTEIKTVYYATANQRKVALQNIIDATSETEIYNLIKSGTVVYDYNILGLPEDVYKATGYDMNKVAKMIFAKKASLSADSNKNIDNSLEIIRQLIIVSAFNQDMRDVIAKDGYLLHEDIMGYSSLIDTAGVTLYNLYKTAVSKEGRDLIIDYILAETQDYADVNALISKMIPKMLLIELEYPIDNGGVGYVSNVLTSANTTIVGLSIPKYFAFSDKSGIDKAIAQATIAINDDITKVVNDYYRDNYNPGNPNDSGSGSTGGGFSSGSSSVSSFGADQPYLDSIANQTATENSGTVFKDVSKNHWASNYILELYDKNILSGKGDGTFAPEDGLTRAELVKIIVAAKNLKPNGASIPFTDVSADSWYLPYVQAAYSNGIISGVTDTSFAPDQKISRQDLCVVLYRLTTDKTAGEINFTDSNNIAPYALDAVRCFVNLGIINGFEDGSFRANDGCTRAQCAKIISMFLQQ